jgi:hypothetical protein
LTELKRIVLLYDTNYGNSEIWEISWLEKGNKRGPELIAQKDTEFHRSQCYYSDNCFRSSCNSGELSNQLICALLIERDSQVVTLMIDFLQAFNAAALAVENMVCGLNHPEEST